MTVAEAGAPRVLLFSNGCDMLEIRAVPRLSIALICIVCCCLVVAEPAQTVARRDDSNLTGLQRVAAKLWHEGVRVDLVHPAELLSTDMESLRDYCLEVSPFWMNQQNIPLLFRIIK